MKPLVSTRMLIAASIVAFFTVQLVVVLISCATHPDVPTVAANALDDARAHLDDVGSALEQAAKTIDAATKTLDALVRFRSAFEAERYSEALSHLEKALAEAESAGYASPPEMTERLGQAKLLLQLAGK